MIDFGYINSNRKAVKLNYLLEKPKAASEIDYNKRDDVKNESIQMIESWPTKNNGNCLFLVIEF